MVGREGVVGCRCTGAKSCDLNERRNQEAEEIHGSKRLPMRVDTWARLRGWFTLPRAWRLSADKPKSRYPSDYYEPSNLHQRNERAHPSVLFLSLSLSFCFRVYSLPSNCQKLRYPWICVWIALVLSEIRMFRERNVFTWFTYNGDQTTRRFEWTCVIAVRASMRAIRFDLAFRDFRVLHDTWWRFGICSERVKLIFRFFLRLIRDSGIL